MILHDKIKLKNQKRFTEQFKNPVQRIIDRCDEIDEIIRGVDNSLMNDDPDNVDYYKTSIQVQNALAVYDKALVSVIYDAGYLANNIKILQKRFLKLHISKEKSGEIIGPMVDFHNQLLECRSIISSYIVNAKNLYSHALSAMPLQTYKDLVHYNDDEHDEFDEDQDCNDEQLAEMKVQQFGTKNKNGCVYNGETLVGEATIDPTPNNTHTVRLRTDFGTIESYCKNIIDPINELVHAMTDGNTSHNKQNDIFKESIDDEDEDEDDEYDKFMLKYIDKSVAECRNMDRYNKDNVHDDSRYFSKSAYEAYLESRSLEDEEE
jgi:hypothetical protein